MLKPLNHVAISMNVAQRRYDCFTSSILDCVIRCLSFKRWAVPCVCLKLVFLFFLMLYLKMQSSESSVILNVATVKCFFLQFVIMANTGILDIPLES